ncbi:MAG: FAD-dependent monooxygenase [Pseudomonadota bacterium]
MARPAASSTPPRHRPSSRARSASRRARSRLADNFTREGLAIHAVNLYSGGKPIMRLAFDGLESAFPYVLSLAQSETERILGEHLERLGGRIERGVKLTGFAPESDGVAVTLESADGTVETVAVRWLAGCDGALRRCAISSIFRSRARPTSSISCWAMFMSRGRWPPTKRMPSSPRPA